MTKLVWHRIKAFECPRCGHLASTTWKTCDGCDSEIGVPVPVEPAPMLDRMVRAIAAGIAFGLSWIAVQSR